jgi:hypothetical protein
MAFDASQQSECKRKELQPSLDSLKPLPKACVIIPSMAVAVRLAKPQNYGWLRRTREYRPDLACGMHFACATAVMALNDNVLFQPNLLTCFSAALVFGDGIAGNEIPFFPFVGHGNISSYANRMCLSQFQICSSPLQDKAASRGIWRLFYHETPRRAASPNRSTMASSTSSLRIRQALT